MEALTLDDFEALARGWLRSQTKLPLLLKGILDPDDAKLALEHGAAGVVVSNHGGRNLDTVPASIDALPLLGRASITEIDRSVIW